MAKLNEYALNNDYKWYAVYTRGNYEKVVENDLSGQDIEVFLPRRKVLRIWSDRKKWIEEPLFHSYIFVKISSREYPKVIHHPAVLYFVSFEGKPAVVRNEQIDAIKIIIDNNISYSVTDSNIEPGQKVEFIIGPLKGYTGEVISFEGKNQVLIGMCNLNYSLIVQIQPGILRRA